MSIRGQDVFQPGEFVLCFEPDPSKARVLYDAKVLESQHGRDTRGRKKLEYHIHFQGWNSSWDRVVPDSFVLKNTPANRGLMTKLAEAARNIRNNKSRNRKIRCILSNHFKRKIHFESSSDDDDDSSDDDDDDDDDDMEDSDDVDSNKSASDNDDVVNVRGRGMKELRSHHQKDSEERENKENESETENNAMNGHQEEKEQIVQGFINDSMKVVEVDIPEKLKHRLVDDHHCIHNKKMVKLPADPSVVTILEGYVKHFAVNILCSGIDKFRSTHCRDSTWLPPERNIELCKEVMDGLRVMFDFALPTILLYNSEQGQFTQHCTGTAPATTIKQNISIEDADIPRSPRLRSASRHQGALHAVEEPAKKQLKLSPSVQDKPDLPEQQETSRRVTRHSLAEESKKTKLQPETPSTDNKKSHTPNLSDTPSRRESLRSRTRHTSGTSGISLPVSNETADKSSDQGSVCGGTLAAPPEGSTGPRSISADSEAELQNVLNWRLVPESEYLQSPPLPCTLYGIQHLLRLFVQLPNLLGKMAIPDCKMKAVGKHVDMLLRYLCEREEELFTDHMYVDNRSPVKGSKPS